MIKKPNILAIIPVRGGSKSVPRKNIKPLNGRPLMHYMQEAAMNSKYISKLIISSEDDEILAVAEELGGKEMLLKRPAELAEDTTLDIPVIKHVVEETEDKNNPYDIIVMLHATVPLTTTEDIDKTIEALLSSNKADSAVSVFEITDFHPMKMKKIENGRLLPYVDSMTEENTVRRQDLTPVYKRTTGVYVANRDVMMERGTVWGEYVVPHIVPHERAVDINSVAEFIIAETMMKYIRSAKD